MIKTIFHYLILNVWKYVNLIFVSKMIENEQ